MADQLKVENDAVDQGQVDEHNQEMLNLVESQNVNTEAPQIGNDDKFQGDYNKLKESYDQLEAKLGQPNRVDPSPTETPVEGDSSIPQDPEVAEGAFDMAALTAEYTANGQLSDASYKQLEAGGVSRQIADDYIAGQKALGQQIGDGVRGSVGGDEAYGNMVDWAKANYTQDQIQAYDKAVNSGNVEMAKIAAKGLQADFQNSEGVEGTLIAGQHAQPEGAGDVFRSNAEVTKAMADPRYEYDTAFRADVLRKLDRSDIFSQGKL